MHYIACGSALITLFLFAIRRLASPYVDPTTGSETDIPPSTTYVLDCSNTFSGNARALTTAFIISAPPTATLNANPYLLSPGQATTLRWSSTNATSCTGYGFGAYGDIGPVPTSGSQSLVPT